jgi:hypothetical protein
VKCNFALCQTASVATSTCATSPAQHAPPGASLWSLALHTFSAWGSWTPVEAAWTMRPDSRSSNPRGRWGPGLAPPVFNRKSMLAIFVMYRMNKRTERLPVSRDTRSQPRKARRAACHNIHLWLPWKPSTVTSPTLGPDLAHIRACHMIPHILSNHIMQYPFNGFSAVPDSLGKKPISSPQLVFLTSKGLNRPPLLPLFVSQALKSSGRETTRRTKLAINGHKPLRTS